jgi:hypothetical protein
VFFVLAMLCGLLLPGLGRDRGGARDIALRMLWALGAFVGFEWVWASGNFTIMSGTLSAAALALLLRFPLPAADDDRSFGLRIVGAALLGLVVYMMDTTPSLLQLAQEALDRVGLGGSKPVVFAAYALLAFALVLAPFALVVLRMMHGQLHREGGFLARADRWLIDHQHAALRITMLAMYGLYLCAPRLKEYSFFELALYGAVLIVDLPGAALVAALTVGIAIPSLVSQSGMSIEGSFIQLAAALGCFWITLGALSPSAPMVRAAGIEPAQRLRTEGFKSYLV